MNQYPKGPWRYGIKGWDEKDEQVIIEKPYDYVGPGHYENPSIYDADGNEVVGCDEYHVFSTAENKRLIVAAPDLLEALAHCEMRLTAMVGMSDLCANEIQRSIDMARAAIAKASGEKK